MTLKFEFGLDFLTMQIPAKFKLLMFNRSEVIVLTNKQTNKQIHKQRDSAENIHVPPLGLRDAGGKLLIETTRRSSTITTS